MGRALRLLLRIGQWFFLAGVVLAALGFAGWGLALLRHPAPFLVDLGLMALPLFFVGIVAFFIATILQFLMRRRKSS